MSSVRPYSPNLVSLPDGTKNAVPIQLALRSETWESIQLSNIILRPSDPQPEGPLPGLYTDEVLRRSRSTRIDFYARLLSSNIVGAVRRSRGVVSPFFVKKKDDRLRLILDCRRVNRKFRRPPAPDMGRAE
eukprot:3129018-Karenia_brevis.AAC.1